MISIPCPIIYIWCRYVCCACYFCCCAHEFRVIRTLRRKSRNILQSNIWRRMSAFLFFMHLDTVDASAAKLWGNSPLVKRKAMYIFWPGIMDSLPKKRPSTYLNNRLAVFLSIVELPSKTPWLTRRAVTTGSSLRWIRIWTPFARNPIGWLRIDRNESPKEPANLSWISAEAVFHRFPQVLSSKSMSMFSDR